jgi:hypothetical protein
MQTFFLFVIPHTPYPITDFLGKPPPLLYIRAYFCLGLRRHPHGNGTGPVEHVLTKSYFYARIYFNLLHIDIEINILGLLRLGLRRHPHSTWHTHSQCSFTASTVQVLSLPAIACELPLCHSHPQRTLPWDPSTRRHMPSPLVSWVRPTRTRPPIPTAHWPPDS